MFEHEAAGAPVAGALGGRAGSIAASRSWRSGRDGGTSARAAARRARSTASPCCRRSRRMIRLGAVGAGDTDDDVVRQLSAADAALERRRAQRCFARLVDGRWCRPAASTRTARSPRSRTSRRFPDHRQRGYGEAVVARAATEASAAPRPRVPDRGGRPLGRSTGTSGSASSRSASGTRRRDPRKLRRSGGPASGTGQYPVSQSCYKVPEFRYMRVRCCRHRAADEEGPGRTVPGQRTPSARHL